MMPIPGLRFDSAEDEDEQPAATQADRKRTRTQVQAPEPEAPKGIPGLRFDKPAAPSLREQAGAFGGGAVQTFADVLPLAGGATGAVLGASAAAPTGPGALATGTAGLTLGMGAGASARSAILGFADIPSVEELPPELRPARFAGEVFGGSIPMVGPLAAAARTGFSTGGRLFDRVVDLARRKPVGTAVAETATTSAVAGAEFLAESAAPGETSIRVGAGLAAGFTNPTQWVGAAAEVGRATLRRVSSSVSKTGVESRAGAELRRVIESAGGDPREVADALDRLRRELPEGATPTAAQLSNNPALLALESELSRRSAQFGRERKKLAEQSLSMLRNSADLLAATGDPADLRAAAEMRSVYFDGLLSGMVSEAEEGAVKAAQGVRREGAETMSEVSSRAAEIVNGALRSARDREKQLYALVPDGPAAANGVMAEAARLREQDLATMAGEQLEGLPATAEKAVRALRRASEDSVEETGLLDAAGRPITRTVEGSDTPTTVTELLRFRSLMLDEARKAAAAGESRQARIAGRLAEAALEDLNAIPGGVPELDDAREFSRALHDAFTRSFAGQAAATAKTGASRLPPELLVRRATATGQELGALRLRELKEAVEFGSPEAAQEMLDIQEQFIRSAAEKLIAPETGRVRSASALATFRRNYSEVLAQFPELRESLTSVERATDKLQGVQATAQQAERAIQKRTAFAQLMRTENPVQEVGRILAGSVPDPQARIRQLAVLARRDGPDAVAGLQSAVVQDAIARSSRNGELDFGRLEQNLFSPRRAGQPSTVDMLRRSGVFGEGEITRLRKLISQSENIQNALTNSDRLDDLLASESAVLDLVLRTSGAALGSAAAQAVNSPNTLIAASAGSRFTRQVLDRIPTDRVQDVMIEAAKDPELFALLLRKAPTPREQVAIGLRLNAFLAPLAVQSATAPETGDG